MNGEINPIIQSFIMNIATAALNILAPVLVGLAASLVYTLVQQVKLRLSASQLSQLQSLGELVVKAAEQAGLAGLIVNEAETKKAWALSELQRLLNERGLSGINISTLSLIIEAAVRDGVHKDPGALFTALAPAKVEVDPYGDTKKF